MQKTRRVPRGKAVAYYYLKTENKKFITQRAKKALLSESAFLDIVLDNVRKEKKAFLVC